MSQHVRAVWSSSTLFAASVVELNKLFENFEMVVIAALLGS